MSITIDADTWIGCTLTDADRHKLGTIEAIYAEEATGEPLWMLIRSGRLSHRRSFVPLVDTRPLDGVIVTPFHRRQIDGAPRIGSADDLGARQVHELYRHYGLRDEVPLDASCRAHMDATVARVLSYVG